MVDASARAQTAPRSRATALRKPGQPRAARSVPARLLSTSPDTITSDPFGSVSETFRPARPDEIDDVARLTAHSFPAPDRDLAYWEDFLTHGAHGGLESLWVAEEGGRLVGSCQLLWLRQWISGVAMPVMGLGAVAIAPTHRKRGLATRMLISGFDHARERGDVATALFPFRAAFYLGLGYGLAGEAHQYQVPPSQLPDDREERMRVQLVDGEADE